MEMESTFVPGVADPAQPWLNRQDKIVMRPAVPTPTPTRSESAETIGQKLSRVFKRAIDAHTGPALQREVAAGNVYKEIFEGLPADMDRATLTKLHTAVMDFANAHAATIVERDEAGANAIVSVLLQNLAYAQAETRNAKAASPVSGGQPDIQIELPPIHVHLPDSLNLTVNDGQKSDLVMEQSADGRETRVRRRDPR